MTDITIKIDGKEIKTQKKNMVIRYHFKGQK